MGNRLVMPHYLYSRVHKKVIHLLQVSSVPQVGLSRPFLFSGGEHETFIENGDFRLKILNLSYTRPCCEETSRPKLHFYDLKRLIVKINFHLISYILKT